MCSPVYMYAIHIYRKKKEKTFQILSTLFPSLKLVHKKKLHTRQPEEKKKNEPTHNLLSHTIFRVVYMYIPSHTRFSLRSLVLQTCDAEKKNYHKLAFIRFHHKSITLSFKSSDIRGDTFIFAIKDGQMTEYEIMNRYLPPYPSNVNR